MEEVSKKISATKWQRLKRNWYWLAIAALVGILWALSTHPLQADVNPSVKYQAISNSFQAYSKKTCLEIAGIAEYKLSGAKEYQLPTQEIEARIKSLKSPSGCNEEIVKMLGFVPIR